MRNRAGVILRLFAMLFSVYALLRLAFMLIYFGEEDWTFLKWLDVFYRGFRMDFAALFYINIPILAYYFLIEPFLSLRWKNKITLVLFSFLNLPFIAVNFIDLVYFRFNHRRTTTDLLNVFLDSSSAFGSFVVHYWFVIVVFLVTAFAVVNRSAKFISRTRERRSSLPAYFVTSIIFLGTCFMIARGFSKRPIQPSTALLYMDARYQPLINNSTFNFLYSALRKQTTLERKNYFSRAQLDSLAPIRHQYKHDAPFERRNVVIFVLESFSREFFKGERLQARMPFFDSLMQRSNVFNNAFANALESNKGLPAILASWPDVMDEPVYLSNYSNIPFKGIGTILKEQGYNTSFFMGAEFDHFGFARLSRMVGIDNYYSRESYGKHNEQHDGTWGIYDEHFFGYFAREISKKPAPFFSVLFNISSHSPYRIPADKEWLKVPGQGDHQNSITYVDYCFQKLFDRLSRESWFNNTIFVFVSDHGYRYTNDRNEVLREMRIPLFIYDPRQPAFRPSDRVVKQLDVVPSILDKLKYPGAFTSFGSSVYRGGPSYSVNRLNGMYHYIDSTDLIGFDDVEERVLYQYKWRDDFSLARPVPADSGASAKTGRLKAFLQRVNNALVNNKLD